MKIAEIIVATIVVILMRHRIGLALAILLCPSSWIKKALCKAVKEGLLDDDCGV